MASDGENFDYTRTPAIVTEFCLNEVYPQLLFWYKQPRQPPTRAGLELPMISLAWAETPICFGVHLYEDATVCARMSREMATLYSQPDRRQQFEVTDQFFHVGMPVAARYIKANDLRWYRGSISRINPDTGEATIKFVDYGNEQTNDRSQLRMLPSSYGSTPPLAILCRLKGLPESYENADTFKLWASALRSGCCLAKFCSEDRVARLHYVRLFDTETGNEFEVDDTDNAETAGCASETSKKSPDLPVSDRQQTQQYASHGATSSNMLNNLIELSEQHEFLDMSKNLMECQERRSDQKFEKSCGTKPSFMSLQNTAAIGSMKDEEKYARESIQLGKPTAGFGMTFYDELHTKKLAELPAEKPKSFPAAAYSNCDVRPRLSPFGRSNMQSPIEAKPSLSQNEVTRVTQTSIAIPPGLFVPETNGDGEIDALLEASGTNEILESYMVKQFPHLFRYLFQKHHF